MIQEIGNWCSTNEQTLNGGDKSSLLIHQRSIGESEIRVPDLSVPVRREMCVLGVVLNKNLSWEDHVDKMCKKAGKGLHILRTLRYHVTNSELHEVYNAAVR